MKVITGTIAMAVLAAFGSSANATPMMLEERAAASTNVTTGVTDSSTVQPRGANIPYLQGYDGGACDGNAGKKESVPSYGSTKIINLHNRHSVGASPYCNGWYHATFCESAGCNSGRTFYTTIDPSSCYNINTGWGVESVNIGCEEPDP